jgi:AraC-like DNA-binding protein
MYFEVNEAEQEQTEHRIGDFPLAIYHRILDRTRNDELMWHWHEEFQLTFVLSGTLELSVGKETYQIHEKSGIIINSRRLHHAVPLTETAEYVCIDFSSHFLNEQLYQSTIKPLQDNQNFICRLLTLAPHQQAILQEIAETPQAYNFLKIYELILSCLNEIGNSPASSEKKEDQDIYQLLNFVHQNFQQDITVAAIAQVIPINKNKCTSLFKAYTNQSPMNYTIDYRLLKAKERLLETEETISEICFAVGFNNLSYFIARFKKKYGCSPKQFRKRFVGDVWNTPKNR